MGGVQLKPIIEEYFASEEHKTGVPGLGDGSRGLQSPFSAETFLWQLEGSAVINIGAREVRLRQDDTLRVPANTEFHYVPSSESLTLSVVMDAKNKLRPQNN